MEDLSNRWKSLTLSEKEGSGLALKSDQATLEFSLVARFLTKRPINLDVKANTFNPLRRTKTGFRMKYIGDHLVLFSFDYKEDVDRIIAAEPWSFDKNLMVVSRYENETEMVSSNLNTVSFLDTNTRHSFTFQEQRSGRKDLRAHGDCHANREPKRMGRW